jgi:5-methylcytosine-specific restriction endonuclease McrA
MSRLSSKSKKVQRSRMKRRRRRFCAHCGTANDLTIDHIIPLAKGGANQLHNLQMLCAACNTKKADSHPYRTADILGKISSTTDGKGTEL